MTDLSNIWTEHMSRQDILNRADEDATTIDPSENPDQLEVLLGKIGEALSGEPGCTASLENGLQEDSMKLTVSTKLPAPLRPLIWIIYLSKEPQSSTSQHLILPLLRAEAGWEARQRTLLDYLSKKDWVLGKLFDKIEGMGIDLSTIFPGVSGLLKAHGDTLLSQAANYIKGVAPFDEQEWLDKVAKSSPDSVVAANILAEVSGSADTREVERLGPPPDSWWAKLAATRASSMTPPKRGGATKAAEKKIAKNVSEMDTDTDSDDLDDDDEFERQETPPRLKKAKGPERQSPATTATTAGTDGEKDHEHGPMKRRSPSPEKPPAKKLKGLGIIGGKKQLKQKSPTPPPPSPPRDLTSPTSKMDEATDSGTDHDSRVSPFPSRAPTTPKPSASTITAPKPRGLGVIGGKKKEPPQQQISQPSLSPESQGALTPEPKLKRVGKLGMIGGKARKTSEVPPSASSRTRAETTTPPPPAKSECDEVSQRGAVKQSPSPVKPSPQETEQERADRKREELKRQLEAKSKAPAKKKRRF
ncbi:hypothetical protein IFM61606_09740 [Aspergillus udagawae]|uniref:Non-homologous end-joining factor 1 n=1 Tax=Aspergillus udagawae TaxID=91492 RepID=A0ABQ1B7M7_9EURO|nr:hypothetical protein IFM61606_09740 [Aspergillus udagawae]GFF55578.1 hypothetical protein IFM51744_08670 [Aspergillus udagawae]GFF95419.1 hypothetical protein IFM53868_08015 [Aspergillus udagawae]GFG12095.1 hypothetical protein IFM5058_05773 [Aspergillus udagawae]